MAVRATVTAAETRGGVYNLLQGVVPVEEGFSGSLRLRDPLGNLVPTEQHVGIRGPGGLTRTLELRARAFSPLPGGPQTYTVEDGASSFTPSFHSHQTFTLLCEAPNTQADPSVVTFTSRLLLSSTPNTGGPSDVTRTVLRSGEMTSASGSRLFGWRAHIMTVTDEDGVWLVKMSIQNANVGTPGNPLGAAGILHDVFFNEIRLSMPVGYALLHLHPNAQYTTSTKLMAPDPSGKDHVLMQGGAKHYRFAIYAPGKLARATVLLNMFGVFKCDHSTTLWSWSNPATPWYGPHAKRVPDLDLSNHHPYGSQYTTIASGLLSGVPFQTGDAGNNSTPLGPYHVRGPTDGGYSSGNHITPFRGYEFIDDGAVSKLKAHMAILSMDVDRAASKNEPGNTGVFICDSDQAPIRVSDWSLTNLCFISYPGKLNSNHQGPWPRLSASQWRLQHASQPSINKVPGYYSQLGNFNLYKDSHAVRPTAACVPLIWLLNDPLAKDYVAHFAAWGRAHTLEYGATSGNLSGSGSLWWSYEGATDGLGNSTTVQAYPGKGARKGSELCGRIGGWAIFAQMMDWLATDDDTKRDDYTPWLTMLKAHHELAQLSVGSRNWHAMDSYGDHPVGDLFHQWESNGYSGHPNAAASQTIECGIHAGAILTVHAVTGDDDWLAMLADAMTGLWAYHRVPGTGTYHFVCPVRPIDITGGSPWATQGEAPDCFTEPPHPVNNPLGLDYDNDQVGTLIAAALQYNPSHPAAWAAIHALLGTSTPEGARDALEALFPDKMEESWGPVLAFLQGFTDSPTAAPSPAVVQLVANSPTVDAPPEAHPSPAVVGLTARSPSTGFEIVATPSAAVMGLEAGTPTRTGPAADPSPAVVQLVAVMPDVTAPVGVTATPGPAVVGLTAVAATAYTSLGASPSAAVVQLLAAIHHVGDPPEANPSPAVLSLVAVDPWDLEGSGDLTGTLTARQEATGAVTARQTGSVKLTATQIITAQLAQVDP